MLITKKDAVLFSFDLNVPNDTSLNCKHADFGVIWWSCNFCESDEPFPRIKQIINKFNNSLDYISNLKIQKEANRPTY